MSNIRFDEILNKSSSEESVKKSDINVYNCYLTAHSFNGGTANYFFGFGDFIRGSYTVWSVCRDNGYNFDIYIHNHPIKKFIIPKNENVSINSYVSDFTMYGLFLHKNGEINRYLKDRLHKKSIYFSTNSYMGTKMEMYDLHEDYKTFIKDRLETTDEFKKYYNEMTCGVVPKSYAIIHIRNGDPVGEYEVNDKNLNLIDNIIKDIKYDKDIYIISDNKFVSKHFSKVYGFKILNTGDISHTGHNFNEDDIKNTLVDFFFVANSDKVFHLTGYCWPSAFVVWPTKIYDIPMDVHHYKKH